MPCALRERSPDDWREGVHGRDPAAARPLNRGMLHALRAAAAATLRGFFRDRGLLAAVVLSGAALAAAGALASASLESTVRLAADLGWGAAGFFGWLLVLAHGSGLADRGGILCPAMLTRAVSPRVLLAGRFLGLSAGVSVYAGLVTVLLLGWLGFAHGVPPLVALATGWLLLLRLLVLLALSVLFFALVRPAAAPLAAAAALGGWLQELLPPVAGAAEGPSLTALIGWLLPDLRALEPPLAGISADPAGIGPVLLPPTMYALLYAAGIVGLAVSLFPHLRRAAPGGGR